jgi:hypothetical protein
MEASPRLDQCSGASGSRKRLSGVPSYGGGSRTDFRQLSAAGWWVSCYLNFGRNGQAPTPARI